MGAKDQQTSSVEGEKAGQGAGTGMVLVLGRCRPTAGEEAVCLAVLLDALGLLAAGTVRMLGCHGNRPGCEGS